jgi:hypothetical protein
MGILTGNEILFYLLGVISTLSVFGIVHLHRGSRLKWYATVLAALGMFLIVFTIAWWVSGIQEGEPQAGNMGLLLFGLPGLLLLGITQRLVVKKNTLVEVADESEAEVT